MNIDNFVFDKYTDILINRSKYSDSELSAFYIQLNNIISQYTSKKSPGTYLVLAIIINFDKHIDENINKINLTEKVITDFALWYNTNYSNNYMKVLDNITNGFRLFMVKRQGNIRDYMPSEIFIYNFTYNKQLFILSKFIYGITISIIMATCYYYFDISKLTNIFEIISNYPIINTISNTIQDLITNNIYKNIPYCSMIDYPPYLYDSFCYNITN